jgi:hypothetical protein
MFSIRRLLLVGVVCVTLAGMTASRASAQPATGPSSGPAASGGSPSPQVNRTVFTNESLPKMLKDLGYNVTEKASANGPYWQIVTQSENWSFTVQVLPMVNQGKITCLLLTSDLGRKINPQASAQDVLKLLQWNQELGYLIYFGYNAQTGCVTAQRPINFPDATQDELRFLFDDYFKTIRQHHAVWNQLSNGGAAAANQGAAVNADKPAPAPQAQVSVAGSTWSGTENLPGFGKLTFVFRANGSATMIDTKGETAGNWTQNGNDVTVNFNGCVYQGRINGQSLAGSGRITSGNQAGQTWTFQVALQKN